MTNTEHLAKNNRQRNNNNLHNLANLRSCYFNSKLLELAFLAILMVAKRQFLAVYMVAEVQSVILRALHADINAFVISTLLAVLPVDGSESRSTLPPCTRFFITETWLLVHLSTPSIEELLNRKSHRIAK